MRYGNRREQRGLTLVELLLVLGIGAGIISTVFVTYDGITTKAEADRVRSALSEPTLALPRFVQQANASACDGGAAAVGEQSAVGATADPLGTAASEFDLRLATPANRRCRTLWQTLGSIFSNTDEGTQPGEATYDSDNVVEWHIGSPGAGYDVGFALNTTLTTGALINTNFGVTGAPAGCPNAGAAAPNDVTHFALGVAVENIDVCESVVASYGNLRAVEATACVDEPTWTTPAAVEAEAMLLLCFNNPQIN